ncbi:hypothetical protein MmiEs2_13480 [Methanimicrococcus stummii]|uniref:Uncharacterized protein n=1 Tax=Methanimicrococcus stummii TaxID=3028294 RepID=A0AA96VIT3_9EURY|nr:hypothetical protein [Methanimicrococcus sp. Es2]WNY29131.1 hypothetical protein MmiEs2_13480 [Methanimicrococcus sp. Es2]
MIKESEIMKEMTYEIIYKGPFTIETTMPSEQFSIIAGKQIVSNYPVPEIPVYRID